CTKDKFDTDVINAIERRMAADTEKIANTYNSQTSTPPPQRSKVVAKSIDLKRDCRRNKNRHSL
ncbi:unnamed protein product, partial [Ceratitis capitata]